MASVSCLPRTTNERGCALATKQASWQGLATAMTQLPSQALRQVALKHMKTLLALLAPHPRLVSYLPIYLMTIFLILFVPPETVDTIATCAAYTLERRTAVGENIDIPQNCLKAHVFKIRRAP